MGRRYELYSIYGLIDPRTDEIRYVGKTGDIDARLKTHAQHANSTPKGTDAKCDWLRELYAEGYAPEATILFQTKSHFIAHIAERLWQGEIQALTGNLTNRLCSVGRSSPCDIGATAVILRFLDIVKSMASSARNHARTGQPMWHNHQCEADRYEEWAREIEDYLDGRGALYGSYEHWRECRDAAKQLNA